MQTLFIRGRTGQCRKQQSVAARQLHFSHSASAEGGENLVRPRRVPSDKGMSSGLILVLGPRLGKGRTTNSTHDPAISQELPADEGTPKRKKCFVDVGSLVVERTLPGSVRFAVCLQACLNAGRSLPRLSRELLHPVQHDAHLRRVQFRVPVLDHQEPLPIA